MRLAKGLDDYALATYVNIIADAQVTAPVFTCMHKQ